jgi:hypothetical protein
VEPSAITCTRAWACSRLRRPVDFRPYPLTWQGQNPVSPVVRLTDSSPTALLQDWVVIFAVAFGITGSVLASLLFGWLRRPPRTAPPWPAPWRLRLARFPAAVRRIQGSSPRGCRPGGSRWPTP